MRDGDNPKTGAPRRSSRRAASRPPVSLVPESPWGPVDPEPEPTSLADLTEEEMLVHLLGEYQKSLQEGKPGSVAYTQCLVACQRTHAELVVVRARKAAEQDSTRTDDEVVDQFRADWRALPPRMRDQLQRVIDEEG